MVDRVVDDPNRKQDYWEDQPNIPFPNRFLFATYTGDFRKSFFIGLAYISADGKRILDKLQSAFVFVMNVAGHVTNQWALGPDIAVVDFRPNFYYGDIDALNNPNNGGNWVKLWNESQKNRGEPEYKVVSSIKNL